MQYKHNKERVPFAKELRKKMTKEERHLWYDFLRGYSVRFLRQKVIGKFIVDFYCAEAKLVIELDGSQHGEAEAIEYDSERTAFLKLRLDCASHSEQRNPVSFPGGLRLYRFDGTTIPQSK